MALLQTPSFTLELPADWKIQSLGPPATVIGPSGQCVMVSSISIQPDGCEADTDSAKVELEKNACDAMEAATADPQLVITGKLTRSETPSRRPFFEVHCRTKDGNTFFSQFAVAGPNNSVLVTVEGDRASMPSVALVRTATMQIAWDQPKKRPFWKFW